jgi:hypothetical protein
MIIHGRFLRGVVVPDEPIELPEGTTVMIKVIETVPQISTPRQGGMWKGRVSIALDFDTLPSDVANAFGIGIAHHPES